MENNYVRPKTYDDFIARLKSKCSHTEQISEITNYFLYCVDYDYNTMETLRNPQLCNEVEERFKGQPRETVFSYIIKEWGIPDDFIETIRKNYHSSSLYVAALNIVTKKVDSNGLLTKGLCYDFANYIEQLCDELGIPIRVISGKTPVPHYWNMFPINGNEKHYDITYAKFAFDKKYGCDKYSQANDWLLKDYQNLKYLEPKRKREIEYKNEHAIKNYIGMQRQGQEILI